MNLFLPYSKNKNLPSPLPSIHPSFRDHCDFYRANKAPTTAPAHETATPIPPYPNSILVEALETPVTLAELPDVVVGFVVGVELVVGVLATGVTLGVTTAGATGVVATTGVVTGATTAGVAAAAPVSVTSVVSVGTVVSVGSVVSVGMVGSVVSVGMVVSVGSVVSTWAATARTKMRKRRRSLSLNSCMMRYVVVVVVGVVVFF
jgi:hypothetical protein